MPVPHGLRAASGSRKVDFDGLVTVGGLGLLVACIVWLLVLPSCHRHGADDDEAGGVPLALADANAHAATPDPTPAVAPPPAKPRVAYLDAIKVALTHTANAA